MNAARRDRETALQLNGVNDAASQKQPRRVHLTCML